VHDRRGRRLSAPTHVARTVTLWRYRLRGFGIAGLIGLAIFFFAPNWLHSTTRFVAAFDGGALSFLLATWLTVMHRDPMRTKARAAIEDPGRNVVFLAIFAAVIAGFASAIVIIGRGPRMTSPRETAVVYTLGIAAVIIGWFLIHTLYTFRYAHLYYYDCDDDGVAQRGLLFPGKHDPSDYDFAYFSFVFGMTFQVSDVEITDPGVRRIAMQHGLISFFYNLSIFGLVVNLLSGLFH
jgi:uncharacterized membrane protein